MWVVFLDKRRVQKSSADGEKPDVLRDNRSVGDLFSMRTPQGREDNDYCVFAKSLTLLYRATR
jgi:hypothetical protein